MKSMIVFAMMMVTACVTAPGDERTEGAKADPQQKTALPAPIQAVAWDPTLKLSAQINLLWPNSVSNAQMLYRTGPLATSPTTFGTELYTPTTLAFDITDGTVAHVYWVVTGSTAYTNLRSAFGSAQTERVNTPSDIDHSGGGEGVGNGYIPPAPRPVIDDYFISGEWQQAAIEAAAQIKAADDQFASYVDDPAETTGMVVQ